jgi:hypothetical protein
MGCRPKHPRTGKPITVDDVGFLKLDATGSDARAVRKRKQSSDRCWL